MGGSGAGMHPRAGGGPQARFIERRLTHTKARSYVPVAYPVRGLHYGPTLAVTLWTLAQAGSSAALPVHPGPLAVIPGSNQTTT